MKEGQIEGKKQLAERMLQSGGNQFYFKQFDEYKKDRKEN